MKFWNDILIILAWLIPFLSIVSAIGLYTAAPRGMETIYLQAAIAAAASGIVTGAVLGAVGWHIEEAAKARDRAMILLERIAKALQKG